MPIFYYFTGHRHWVLCTAWAPNGQTLASACKSGEIRLWDAATGTQKGKPLVGHKQWVTWLVWEPFHLNPQCRKLASSSKDGDVRIWDVVLGTCLINLAGHQQGVSCIRWGGTGLIYSASQVITVLFKIDTNQLNIYLLKMNKMWLQDRTVKVWRSEDGILCRTLQGHAHWVNTLALSTDYVLRTGAFEPAEFGRTQKTLTPEEAQKKALDRYNLVQQVGPERLVSGSDDFTLFLWNPETDKKHLGDV
jgi:ribosome assembly protein 4